MCDEITIEDIKNVIIHSLTEAWHKVINHDEAMEFTQWFIELNKLNRCYYRMWVADQAGQDWYPIFCELIVDDIKSGGMHKNALH